MDKTFRLLFIFGLIFFFSCEDLINEYYDYGPGVRLWGENYSFENTTELDLSWNELSGPVPQEIENLTNLEVLWLSDNQLTGSIPHEIENLTNLVSLGLSDNQLTGSIPSEMESLTNLIFGYLYDNQLSGIIPDEICNTFVNIRNNQLCPPYPSCVEDYVGV